MKETRYFAVVGCKNYYGAQILKPGMPVQLIKDPDNEYDGEAIAVCIMPEAGGRNQEEYGGDWV
jgi:hypothetical protein